MPLQHPGEHDVDRVARSLGDRDAARAQLRKPVAQAPAGLEDREARSSASAPAPATASDATVEDALEPAGALDEVTAGHPEPPQTDRQQQGLLGVVPQRPRRARPAGCRGRRRAAAGVRRRARGPLRVAARGELEGEVPAVARLQRSPPRRRRPAAPGRAAGSSRAAGSGSDRPPRSTCTSDLSTSRPRQSRTSARASRSPAQTCSAAGQREAAGEDREPAQQDLLVVGQQGVTPLQRGPQRGVPGDQRRGRPSRASASPSRSAISAGSRCDTRAAASSSASGMPSSRRQISTIAAALSVVQGEAGPTSRARSTKRRTEAQAASRLGSSASAGLGQLQRRNPEGDLARRRAAAPGSWPAASRPGRRAQTAAASSAQAASRCSQLSRISSRCARGQPVDQRAQRIGAGRRVEARARRRPRPATRRGSVTRDQVDEPDPVGVRADAAGGRPPRRAGSCRRRPPR